MNAFQETLRACLQGLEPAATDHGDNISGDATWFNAVNSGIAFSAAVSLKRIADAMEKGMPLAIDPYSFGRDLGTGFQHGNGS